MIPLPRLMLKALIRQSPDPIRRLRFNIDKEMTMRSSFVPFFLAILAGPLIWAAHFMFVYAVNGLLCARPGFAATWLGGSISSWIIVIASLIAVAGMSLAYLRVRTRPPQVNDPAFVVWLAGALSALSAIAVIWETLPALLVPPCG